MPPQRTIEDEICDKYESERRRHTSHYSAGNRHDRHWEKAAAIVRQIGADPRLFVEAQFAPWALGIHQAYPFPQQVHGPKAAYNYEKYMEAFRGKAEECVKNQFRYLGNFVSLGGLSVDQALRNSSHPFRAFFRILSCSDEVLDEFCSTWLREALWQLQSDRDLREYLLKNHGYRTKRIIRQDVSGEDCGTFCEMSPPPPPPPERQGRPGRF